MTTALRSGQDATYRCRSCGQRHRLLVLICPFTKIPREMTL